MFPLRRRWDRIQVQRNTALRHLLPPASPSRDSAPRSLPEPGRKSQPVGEFGRQVSASRHGGRGRGRNGIPCHLAAVGTAAKDSPGPAQRLEPLRKGSRAISPGLEPLRRELATHFSRNSCRGASQPSSEAESLAATLGRAVAGCESPVPTASDSARPAPSWVLRGVGRSLSVQRDTIRIWLR